MIDGRRYYTLQSVYGEGMDQLLKVLKDLINSKKVTDNLPDNSKNELKLMNNKIDSINTSGLDIDTSIIDGGNYISNE